MLFNMKVAAAGWEKTHMRRLLLLILLLAATLALGGISRLLKKSFASTGKDGVVAVVEGQLDLVVPSSSSSADPSPEISS